jgi:hypothetical protein
MRATLEATLEAAGDSKDNIVVLLEQFSVDANRVGGRELKTSQGLAVVFPIAGYCVPTTPGQLLGWEYHKKL